MCIRDRNNFCNILSVKNKKFCSKASTEVKFVPWSSVSLFSNVLEGIFNKYTGRSCQKAKTMSLTEYKRKTKFDRETLYALNPEEMHHPRH